eukprot:NODE_422_length_7706_cov_0.257229.p2 type:complete len:280 gc:universal NODE_422_length_7706_cov_0.257229:525-1364(+)
MNPLKLLNYGNLDQNYDFQFNQDELNQRLVNTEIFGSLFQIIHDNEEEVSYSGMSSNYQCLSYFLVLLGQQPIHPVLVGLTFKYLFKLSQFGEDRVRFPIIIPILTTQFSEEIRDNLDQSNSNVRVTPAHVYELVTVATLANHSSFIQQFASFNLTINSRNMGKFLLLKELDYLDLFCNSLQLRASNSQFLFDVLAHELHNQKSAPRPSIRNTHYHLAKRVYNSEAGQLVRAADYPNSRYYETIQNLYHEFTQSLTLYNTNRDTLQHQQRYFTTPTEIF